MYKKRLTLTLYPSNELNDSVNKAYAKALLDGETVTKQQFLLSVLKNGLTKKGG